jgi:hypothetical protein
VLGAQPHDRGDLTGISREDDNVGGMAALERVGAVDRSRLIVGANELRPEERLELCSDAGCGCHALRPWSSYVSVRLTGRVR